MIFNPIVPAITGTAERYSDVMSINTLSRNVFLVGEINSEMSAAIISQLLYLDSLNHDPINLYINSPGGEVASGMAIYDTMHAIESSVNTICMGMAASMGAVILSGGEKRTALKHSEIMIHQPSGGVVGKATDILVAAEHVAKTKQMLYEVLANNTGKTVEKIATDAEADCWMSSKEALEYGIINAII